MSPHTRMHLTGYRGLRPLPPAGDACRWAAAIERSKNRLPRHSLGVDIGIEPLPTTSSAPVAGIDGYKVTRSNDHTMKTVSKSRLKARALEYFREVETTGQELAVTGRGKPVLEIVPSGRDARAVRRYFFRAAPAFSMTNSPNDTPSSMPCPFPDRASDTVPLVTTCALADFTIPASASMVA